MKLCVNKQLGKIVYQLLFSKDRFDFRLIRGSQKYNVYHKYFENIVLTFSTIFKVFQFFTITKLSTK